MHIFFYTLFLLTLPPHQAQQTQADLSVIISRKALDFLLSETQKVLNGQLATLKLPSANQEIEGGSVEVHDVFLKKFVQPKYFYDLEPPHTLIWGLNDASLFVNGQWSGMKKVVLPYLKGSGGFEADLEQLSLLLRAQLGKNETSNLTKIDAFLCNATIANLTTRATGVWGYVLSIFRNTVSSKIKPLLENAICMQMEDLIDQDIDRDLLQQLPTKYDIGRKFLLVVTMVAAPVVDRSFIQLDHRVGVQYDGKDETSAYQGSGQVSAESASPLDPTLDRMIYVRISENPANMLLYTMHRMNMTTFIIDEHTSQQTADYLRLDCPTQENCLGHSMQGISAIYPAPAKGAFRVYTSRSPTITFTDGSADLSAPVTMEIDVYTGPPQYAQDNLFIADIDMAANVHFSIDKDGKKVLGDWNVYKFALTVRNNGVGSLVKIDNQKLAESIKGFVIDQGNRMLSTGFDVPVASTFVPGYTLTNMNLKVLKRLMQFEADLAVQQAFKTNF